MTQYSIKDVSKMSHVSTRTLRYYDEIGLLKPDETTFSGERLYDAASLDRLQLILFYRKLGVKLTEIKRILDEGEPSIDILKDQKSRFQKQVSQLKIYLSEIDNTIAYYEGGFEMNQADKFRAFKHEKIKENEKEFGDEVRAKYDETTIKQANEKWEHLTESAYQEGIEQEEKLIRSLNTLLEQSSYDLDDPVAKDAFEAHKRWLEIYAPYYNAEYHKSLAEMYVADERFSAYYNSKTVKPSVHLLKEIIDYYA
ncbi:MerR family transcriptional regulator [Staphylococcus massiliensis]|uniref:MerR family transcriptional regulator n=1 Tax=Staphylococcus massiliensis TaxID=555791 RepID=UPI001EDE1A66|nr:MerR family transcriptional regulator [Staphylococcus massiliensis]MCG3400221.1 MerR family transcriptional regulator [Staphylococcus massiliensis]